ncbi:hypothetical protein ACJMK2_005858 [Sinanodonta woodiana]|uniref:Uncharacterized protein n=1 Tax=Sinanodonta woodiana TaxID=1069815 RepID=A0ABD3VRD4_SINWO
MSVDDMVQILPMLGDRIVLKSFKTMLIQSLCAKLGIINTRHCHDTAPKESQDTCTSESSLKKHKVEFGWTATGGGSRKIELPRNSRKEEVLDEAKHFFPTNHAPLDKIQHEITKELYESSKVSLLRLDMVTWKNDSLITESLTITCPLHTSVPVHLLSREEFLIESVLKVTPSHSQPVAASILESVETLSTHSHALQLASFANMYANFTQNHSSDNQILFHPGDNHFNTTSELNDTDAGDVFRDVELEFLETFFIKDGSDIKIPTTVHIMRRKHWEAWAKVIISGYKQEGYLPIQLSQDFLQRCIDGKDVQDEKLLNTFLVDEEDLCNVFSSYEARIMPTKDISKLVIDISHHQIEQNTSFITECWSPLLQWYRYFQVTNNNVLNLLQLPDDLSKSEKLTLYALRQYIKSCNKDKLLAFLLFCTGSDLIVGRQIQVILTTSMSAFNLRPIAHTCGCAIELCIAMTTFFFLVSTLILFRQIDDKNGHDLDENGSKMSLFLDWLEHNLQTIRNKV